MLLSLLGSYQDGSNIKKSSSVGSLFYLQSESSKLLHNNFSLCQNFWKKIQTSGLATEYERNEDFSIKLCHLTALAFLPPSEIPDAFDEIRSLIPSNANAVVQYFEENYVHGRTRKVLRHNRAAERRNPPLFSPNL